MKGLDIEAWLEQEVGIQYITVASDGHREAVCDCPVCGKVKKVWVNLTSGDWTCYFCQSGGSGAAPIVALYAHVHQVSRDKAAQDLFTQRRRFKKAATSAEVVVKPEWKGWLPDEFEPVYDEAGWNVPNYLLDRGISAFTARDYGLGYCSTGKYAGRVILPITRDDVVTGFQGRAVDGREPKYDQPAGMPKSEMLFGYDQAKQALTICVVEGAFDVLGCREAELDAVAIFGKSMSRSQVDLLLSLRPNRVVLISDGYSQDPTAPWMAVRTCDAIWNRGFRNVGLLVPEGKEDPADLGVERPEWLVEQVDKAQWPGERVRRESHKAFEIEIERQRRASRERAEISRRSIGKRPGRS